MHTPTFQAAIFDMDGLLIDSEPFWQEAEIRILRPLGVPLTHADCTQTMGLRIDEVVRFWRSRYPWQSPTDEEVAKLIIQEVERLILEKGSALPGVTEVIETCKSLGMQLAIASSSFMQLISVVVKKLEIERHFSVLHSAEFESHGKPHPAVYLSAAKLLQVEPTACLVFEDSAHGVSAAKAASMTCIAVPGEHVAKEKVAHADMVLETLHQATAPVIYSLFPKISRMPI